MSPQVWEPALDAAAARGGQTVAESLHADLYMRALDASIWAKHERAAAISLARGYVASAVLNRGEARGAAEAWWREVLQTRPHIALAGLEGLDARYNTWRPSDWGADWRADGAPVSPAPGAVTTYRRVLMRAVLEAAKANEARIDAARAELDALPPISRTPPEGKPFDVYPDDIEDPVLAAEYAARLREIERRRYLKGEIDDWADWNLGGITGRNVVQLFEGAEAGELPAVARELVRAGLVDSRLGLWMRSEYPAFDAAVRAALAD
ncbi:MAG: hypothetical protein AAF995_05485 [Planctomycetota bacterium]